MISALQVPAEAYPYLVAQRGALDDMKAERSLWLQKYTDTIFSEFELIRPYLPAKCDSVLDIGSGLGGIDAIINSHYGGDLRVTLVDGVDDLPRVTLHRKTFNHMGIAQRFLERNGVKHFSCIDANDIDLSKVLKYDLIVSFKSWCFHYEPRTYINLALRALHRATVVIVDLRRGKIDWWEQLAPLYPRVIYNGPKAQTAILSLWKP